MSDPRPSIVLVIADGLAPFIADWPGVIPAGQVYETPAVNVDLLPTLASAAGVELDPARIIDGTNILPASPAGGARASRAPTSDPAAPRRAGSGTPAWSASTRSLRSGCPSWVRLVPPMRRKDRPNAFVNEREQNRCAERLPR